MIVWTCSDVALALTSDSPDFVVSLPSGGAAPARLPAGAWARVEHAVAILKNGAGAAACSTHVPCGG